jgi:hypothetical protein
MKAQKKEWKMSRENKEKQKCAEERKNKIGWKEKLKNEWYKEREEIKVEER